MLHACVDFFGCGSVVIDNRKHNTKKFAVTKLDDLVNIIIPFFDKNPLLTSKFLNYTSFKEAVLIVSNNKGKLTSQDLAKLSSIKSSMNTNRTWEEKYNYYHTIFLDRVITPAWLVGFIEGDGCFYLYLNNSNLQHSIEITQSTQDIEILERIQSFLNVGTISPKRDDNSLEAAKRMKSVSRLKIRALSEVESVINIIDLCPLITTKKKDYAIFKEAINLFKKKAALTSENLIKIKVLVESMRIKK